MAAEGEEATVGKASGIRWWREEAEPSLKHRGRDERRKQEVEG